MNESEPSSLSRRMCWEAAIAKTKWQPIYWVFLVLTDDFLALACWLLMCRLQMTELTSGSSQACTQWCSSRQHSPLLSMSAVLPRQCWRRMKPSGASMATPKEIWATASICINTCLHTEAWIEKVMWWSSFSKDMSVNPSARSFCGRRGEQGLPSSMPMARTQSHARSSTGKDVSVLTSCRAVRVQRNGSAFSGALQPS